MGRKLIALLNCIENRVELESNIGNVREKASKQMALFEPGTTLEKEQGYDNQTELNATI